MAVYRRSARPRFVLLLLVLTAVTLLTLDERSRGLGLTDRIRDGARDLFAPVQDSAASAVRPVENFFQGVLHYGDLETENSRLREQLAERNAELARGADADRERRALLDQQDLEFVGDLPAVSARIVVAPPSNFDFTLEINRGRDAGIAPGMPVVTGAGLVGRVVDTSGKRATVMLITDPASSVGVRLTASGDVGVAAGRGSGSPLKVDLIDRATAVGPDEPAVTSGLQGSVFPPGIPVGKAKAASLPPGALQQEVDLQPAVEMRSLELVKVLLWNGQP